MRFIAASQSDEGFSVAVPGLPGCRSQGTADTEAIQNVKNAIRGYLAVVEEQLSGEEVCELKWLSDFAKDKWHQPP